MLLDTPKDTHPTQTSTGAPCTRWIRHVPAPAQLGQAGLPCARSKLAMRREPSRRAPGARAMGEVQRTLLSWEQPPGAM